MRKVILNVAISLDGFIEGPNGEYDWCFNDQDYGLTDFGNRIDTLFYGRKCYEMMLTFDHKGPDPYAKIKKYVFSNTMTKAPEGIELISGNIAKQVIELKRRPGKDIWLFGGADLTTSFMNEGLVDEMSLAVHPILLGAGKLLFNNIQGRRSFKLTESKQYSSGLVILNYER